jgi:2-polyprenyl-3-methyl-5-hydroxy-6-metoxy-1,4-benzoquinol methylase
MIHYVQCPVCKSTSIHYSFSAKDHTVSQETFEVWTCAQCNVLFTQNAPAEEEIAFYYASADYISHSDTKEGLVNQLYHRVRNITLADKKHLVEKETGVAAGKILDVGCGTGAFLDKMKKGGWQVTGIEPDPAAREKAAALYGIRAASASELFHLPVAHFDAITLWHVLEHVHRLHEYIDQLKNLLAENGKLFVAVPNHNSGDARQYGENWAAYDVPRHLYHFSPHSMNVLMNLHGMQIRKMKPMWFDSFYVSMLSEKNKHDGGSMFNAFLSGIASNAGTLLNKEKSSSVIYIISKH